MQKRKGAYLNKVDEHGRNDRFDQLKLMLKSELYSIPGNLAAAKQFQEVVPGQNDYVSCFDAWWLDEVKAMPNGLLIVTCAADEAATAAGLTKYRERLVRLARRYFEEPDKPIHFKLSSCADGGRTSESAGAAPAPVPAGELDVWERVKAELVQQLQALSPREVREGMENFESAIRETKLLGSEMAEAVPVWKIASLNAKKTRAVLQLLRRQVHAAMQIVAGGEVQLMVLDRVGR